MSLDAEPDEPRRQIVGTRFRKSGARGTIRTTAAPAKTAEEMRKAARIQHGSNAAWKSGRREPCLEERLLGERGAEGRPMDGAQPHALDGVDMGGARVTLVVGEAVFGSPTPSRCARAF